MVRFRIVFSGRVQGVGFRATARAVADRHPVTGWVRNEPDGTVLMEVQGNDAGVVLAFLDDLPHRRDGLVRGETRDAITPEGGERGFEVRR